MLFLFCWLPYAFEFYKVLLFWYLRVKTASEVTKLLFFCSNFFWKISSFICLEGRIEKILNLIRNCFQYHKDSDCIFTRTNINGRNWISPRQFWISIEHHQTILAPKSRKHILFHAEFAFYLLRYIYHYINPKNILTSFENLNLKWNVPNMCWILKLLVEIEHVDWFNLYREICSRICLVFDSIVQSFQFKNIE